MKCAQNSHVLRKF